MNNQNLKIYLDRNNIEAVAFDIDNTLLVTTPYYDSETEKLTIQIAKKLNKDPKVFSKNLNNSLYNTSLWEKSQLPILIDDWYIQGLSHYFNGSIPSDLEVMVREFFKDFYNYVPKPHQKAIETLEEFLDTGIKIVLHSHAEEEWTAMKANMISGLVGHQLAFLSTPMTQPKDKDSWIKAFDIVNSKPERGLVVGDNWFSDIEPSIEAGSKHLVWIDRHNQKQELDKYDVDIYVIKEIGEMLNILN
jgi:FMN phosphatase YigB (HAD superfamily)